MRILTCTYSYPLIETHWLTKRFEVQFVIAPFTKLYAVELEAVNAHLSYTLYVIIALFTVSVNWFMKIVTVYFIAI